MQILFDYTFSSPNVDTAAGGHPLNFGTAAEVSGPNNTELGNFPTAIHLGGNHSAKTTTRGLALTPTKFTIRAVVRPVGRVTGRQNIVESTDWPFALMIDKGKTASTCTVVASVNSAHYGWRRSDSSWANPTVRIDRWITIDMLYDHDTLALFVNGAIVDVQAFPRGRLKSMRGSDLWVGSWVDGRRNRFKGDIAALQVIAGAPADLEAMLDEERSSPAWHISRKRIDVEASANLGNEAGPVRRDTATGAYTQKFTRGLIMYHDSIGVAFEMHGAIWTRYQRFGRRAELGYLVSDEGSSTRAGARKSLFSKGGVYWSRATGAKVVLGQIYLDYENMGEASAIGLPTGEARNISGGKEQVFQNARMYLKSGAARAHEVHGAILTRFRATGGISRWGYPITDEEKVLGKGSGAPGREIGRSSEFERATFYWSRSTGAFEVHGSIRRKYLDLSGPAGELGFPTSDEVDIPNHAGSGRMNTFQKGALCWYGSFNSIVVARAFKIHVGRVSTRESEGFLMGQNDLYVNIRATDGAQTYDKRHPRSGDWGGQNSRDINFTIPNTFTPRSPGYSVSFRFRCRDADPGNDDHLGTFNFTLNASNGWGLRQNNGVFNNSFSKVRSLTWSVKPKVAVESLSEIQKWWGKDNDPTSKISYQKYSRAYSDVDSDPEWWDLTDWLEKAFYKLVVQGLAKSGNCFGMSLEGIYARKNRSVFGMPLDRFRTWSTLETEFNIKHCYQVGAQPIWWFLNQFVTGNTHDPKDVFNRTHAAFRRGENPVVCIAQNYDFSGKPHCVMPVGWRKSSTVWRMTILDPNIPGQERELTVNPVKNTFRYVGSNTYTGGEWSGGRFHYMPYDVLDSRPRTPIWDAILLLLAGTIVIFGDDEETVSIKNAAGVDLDAFGNDAKLRLQRGEPIEEFFFDYKGFAGEALQGGMMFRRNVLRATGDIRTDGSLAAHMGIGDVGRGRSRAAETLRAELSSAPPALRRAISRRTAHAVLADTRLSLPSGLHNVLNNLAAANREGSWDHKLRGKRAGKLEYAVVEPLSAVHLTSTIGRGELADMAVRDLASSKQSISMKTRSDKKVDLIYETRLGAGKDRVEVKIAGIPAEANKPLQANIRPGIGGVDVMTHSSRVRARVTLKSYIGGRLQERRYDLPVDGGIRFHIGAAIDEGDLVVGRIEQLFGRPVNVTTLRMK